MTDASVIAVIRVALLRQGYALRRVSQPETVLDLEEEAHVIGELSELSLDASLVMTAEWNDDVTKDIPGEQLAHLRAMSAEDTSRNIRRKKVPKGV